MYKVDKNKTKQDNDLIFDEHSIKTKTKTKSRDIDMRSKRTA